MNTVTELNAVMTKCLLLIVFVSFAAAETYYATPSPDIPCPQPGVPCYTLSQYAASPTGYFNDYTILILMTGNHSLDASFSIRGIQDLTIVAPSPYLTSVTCQQGAGRFVFQDIHYIHISDMDLTECTHSIGSVREFTMEGSSIQGQANEGNEAALALRNVTKGEIANLHFTSFMHVNQDYDTAGGAMYIYNSSVTITGTSFIKNQATQGGAVYVDQHSTVNMDDCVFNENQAAFRIQGLRSNGGAIYQQDPSTVVIRKSQFYHNTASWGGAILSLTDITIIDTVFDHNEATRGSGGGGDFSGRSTIIDCSFNHNKAYMGGGGLRIETGDNVGNNTITGSKFSFNSANFGGAGYFGTVTIRDCYFKENKAVENYDGSRGGAITNLRGFYFAIYNSTFDKNTATGIGGAMHVDVMDMYLVGNVFTNNFAQVGASAIAADQASSAISNMTDTYLSGNYGPVPAVAFTSLPNQKLVVDVYGYLIIRDNQGRGVWSAGTYDVNIVGETTVTNNTGGFHISDGSLNFNGTTEFRDNRYIPSNETNSPQAAAVLCHNAKVTFNGTTKILYDPGVNGGPIATVGCTVSMAGDLTIQNGETVPHIEDPEGFKVKGEKESYHSGEKVPKE